MNVNGISQLDPGMRTIKTWLADRFGVGVLYDRVLNRRVPKAPWYFGDGATLGLLFGVLVLTGVAMSINYSPAPDNAYQSVRHITETQRFGWFIRALHYWSAGFMVVIVVIHMCRQIILGGYKSPREATWLIGVLLLFAILIMSYTGYVLRWDARSLYGIKVGLHMLHNIPAIGEYVVLVVQGGNEIGSRTLARVYALHVVIGPALIAGLILWHLYLVILHGVTTASERSRPVASAEVQRDMYKQEAASEAGGERFHPGTTRKSGAMAMTVGCTVVLVAAFAGPVPLETRATLVDRVFPAEEWWFWWYSGLIALMPPALAPALVVGLPLAAFILLVAAPFFDRGPKRGALKRPLALSVVVIVAICLLLLTDYRRRSPWTAWPSAEPPPIPEDVTLAPQAYDGRWLFQEYGCNTCHAVAGRGWGFGPDLARIPEVRSRVEMRDYILRPPEGIAMPAYEGYISEEDLERLLDFVHAAQTFPRE